LHLKTQIGLVGGEEQNRANHILRRCLNWTQYRNEQAEFNAPIQEGMKMSMEYTEDLMAEMRVNMKGFKKSEGPCRSFHSLSSGPMLVSVFKNPLGLKALIYNFVD
jgi:hypothetical protein